ncbi:MAG: hypothetical protein H0W88_11570 [Parachlamydiaceae bacterium]|nr:hypothetical protein [Parachlamydiaceae bacterium]
MIVNNSNVKPVNFISEQVNKLTPQQKVVSIFAIAILLSMSLTYIIVSNLHRIFPKPKPDLEGTLKGKIIYNKTFGLDVEGEKLKLNNKGLLSGENLTVKTGPATYEGGFENTRFKDGTLKTSFEGHTYRIKVVNFAIESAEILQAGNAKAVDDLVKFEEKLFNNNCFIRPFTVKQYSYSGEFNGLACLKDQKAIKCESKLFTMDETGRFTGEIIARFSDKSTRTVQCTNLNFQDVIKK